MEEYHNVHFDGWLAGCLVGMASLSRWLVVVCIGENSTFMTEKKREAIEVHERERECRGSHLIDNQIANRIGLSLNTAIVFL